MFESRGCGIPSSVGGDDWSSGALDSSMGAKKFASDDGVRQKDFDCVMNASYGDTLRPASATKEQNEKSKGNTNCLWKNVINFFRKHLIKKERG